MLQRLFFTIESPITATFFLALEGFLADSFIFYVFFIFFVAGVFVADSNQTSLLFSPSTLQLFLGVIVLPC